MSLEQRQFIESECARVIALFFQYLDRNEFEALSKLMASNGTWSRQGKILKGAAMVFQELKQRPVGRITLHLVSNLIVDVIDESTTKATFYMTVLRHDGENKPSGPMPMGLPYSASIFQTRFTKEAEAWRIQHMSGQVVFVR